MGLPEAPSRAAIHFFELRTDNRGERGQRMRVSDYRQCKFGSCAVYAADDQEGNAHNNAHLVFFTRSGVWWTELAVA